MHKRSAVSSSQETSKTRYLLISDLNQSPFNVGTLVALEDLTEEQVAELNRRFRSPLRDEMERRRYYALVGGHPYLVRRGLHEMQTHGIHLSDIEAQAAGEEGLYASHLERLHNSLSQDPELMSVIRGVLRGQPCPNQKSFFRLRSAGILTGRSYEQPALRCELYRSYLTRYLL